MMPIFTIAVPVLEKIERAGFKAYFVGGSVRDFILGKEVADVDIATSATPQEIKNLFSKTIDVGIEHGTVVVLFGKETYEVTTFRSEAEYTDFRRPSEVTFIRSLEEDLKRRDFTMNSIAMDKTGRLIDPFCGQAAIQNRIIETVGSPSDRFHEDALRMMRAVRFVSQLSFSIEPDTLNALKENAPLLEKIAIERKTTEFEKLLKGENLKLALEILLDTGLFIFLPGLQNDGEALRKLLNYELTQLSVVELWSLLLYFMEIKQDQVELFLRQWKLPVKKIKQIKSVLYWIEYRLHSQWSTQSIYEAKLDYIMSVEKLYNTLQHQPHSLALKKLRDQYGQLVIKDRDELAVNGHDLMQWEDKKGGLWIKEKLAFIEKAVLTGQVNNQKEKIKEWLLKCNQN